MSFFIHVLSKGEKKDKSNKVKAIPPLSLLISPSEYFATLAISVGN